MVEHSIWQRYMVLGHSISMLSVKQRRHIFHTVRNSPHPTSADLFFPEYGFTLGEFATFQVLLADTRRKRASEGA